MITQLSFEETRVIGVMVEKEKTTPDQYPLSLNALMNGCNQKSNREPVVNFDESRVQAVLDGLREKRLVMEEGGYGSRVPKYKHRFANTEFGELKLNEQELAVIAVMFLRGPQTPGELRTRTNRLCTFKDVQEVEVLLEQLINRDDGPFVVKLPREPGKRESRYAHLFSGEPDLASMPVAVASGTGGAQKDRVLALEERIEALEQRLAQLEARL
ncbi:MAG: DUF480 domain-containing protein [Gammaproteobacteria bacterium]|nr:DUF480 domain-containing protein [Gammaproteobacteria bacterium]